MAHEIENGMIAYSGELPWHGIGAKLEAGSTPQQFLEAAGLDWELNRFPLVADMGDDGYSDQIPNKFGWMRSSDKKMMAVSSGPWQPFQNKDVLDFMRRYCEAGGAQMETAGGLRDGKIVWALAKLNHSFEVRPGDRTEGYILLTSPHVVGTSINLRTTTVRVVCANTMAMAQSGKISYRQNHMSEFDVAGAHEAIELAHEELAAAEARCKTIDRLKLSLEDSVKKVIVPAFAKKLLEESDLMQNIMDPEVMPSSIQSIIHSMQHAPGAIEGTGWGTLNGVTHYCDHVGGRDRATRMYRSWAGDYGIAKLGVEQRLLELAA
jgi:phage/plasmid-like protein (TIGR03299 family)